jgi:hypothetical protein
MGLLLHWNTNAKIAGFFFLLDRPLTLSHFYTDVTSNLFFTAFFVQLPFLFTHKSSLSRNFSCYSIAGFFTTKIFVIHLTRANYGQQSACIFSSNFR